jgi:hypothetical protein
MAINNKNRAKCPVPVAAMMIGDGEWCGLPDYDDDARC